MIRVLFISIFFLCSSLCIAQQREIVITIDDLPLMGYLEETFNNIVQSFAKHKVPVIGFIIANRVNPQTEWQLKLFRQNGFLLGNHSYSHINLRSLSTIAEEYIEDISKADTILAPYLTSPKYYRYPYLAEGRWWTRGKVHQYLAAHHYVIAPVTVDSRDFEFNLEFIRNPKPSMEDFKSRYVDFVWQQTLKAEKEGLGINGKQILLIHTNLLNSYFLDDLLTMYEKNGYRFISMEDAVKV
jgi:peptidoglycan/xylan/chitin deacetylase (PgdA/CDA1 family)